MAYYKHICHKDWVILIKFTPSTGNIKILNIWLISLFYRKTGNKLFCLKAIKKAFFSDHFNYSYIPLITWTPNIPILGWTVQYTLYCTLYCTMHCNRRQSSWLSCLILWGFTSSLLTLYCTLYWLLYWTMQCTVHYIGHCSVHCTVHCALHYTLQWHKDRYWKKYWKLN